MRVRFAGLVVELREEELAGNEEVVEREHLCLHVVLPKQRAQRPGASNEQRPAATASIAARGVPALAEEEEEQRGSRAAEAREAVDAEARGAVWDEAVEEVAEQDEERVAWRMRYAEGAGCEYELPCVAAWHRGVCRSHVHSEDNCKESNAERD